jgi:hypothetical protein
MDQNKLIRDRLRSEFPSLYVKDIDAALKIYNYSYAGTYYHLEQAINSKYLKLKQGSKAKYQTKGSVNGEILSELESVFNIVNPKVECSCCCDEKSFDEFGQCTDGHIICKVCIKKHAENTIYQHLSCKIKCIDCHEKCVGLITEDTLQSILDERVFAEYKNLKKMDEIKEICPALFRTGRLTPIYFGYFENEILQEISKYYYQQELDLPDNIISTISPADILDFITKHKLGPNNKFNEFQKFITKNIKQKNK